MKREHILEAVAIYRGKCVAIGAEATDFPGNKLLPIRSLKRRVLSYCMVVVGKMQGFVMEDRLEDACICLGFIQGVFWVLRIYTLDQLREHLNVPERPPPKSR